jgi:hypothetical protein
MKAIYIVIALAVLISIPIAVVSCSALGWVGDAATVAREEVAPKTLLKKYEWFKDTAATLDKKNADIDVYGKRLEVLNSNYKDVPRAQWARDDREQSNQCASELAGIKASFNSLAAEYNSAMSKINYSFCNVGTLPEGASQALPREFREYKTQ